MPTLTRLHFRWFIRSDLPQVLEVENRSFPEPWTEEDFIKILRRRDCIGMVVEQDDTVIAYFLYRLEPVSVDLISLAVDPAYQRRGIGRQVIDRLVGKLEDRQRKALTTCVRETNLKALLFFREVGFKATNLMKWYYEKEDGIEMERWL